MSYSEGSEFVETEPNKLNSILMTENETLCAKSVKFEFQKNITLKLVIRGSVRPSRKVFPSAGLSGKLIFRHLPPMKRYPSRQSNIISNDQVKIGLVQNSK